MGTYNSDLDTMDETFDEAQEGAFEATEATTDEDPTEGGTDEDVEEQSDEPVTIEDLALDLVSELKGDEISPYQIHSVVNAMFDALQVEKSVRPQMMYNYAKNGLIVKGGKDRKRFTSDEVVAFATKFVSKYANK